ncbi:hypothetical protein AAEU29_18370 [Pseudoalteromonas sp. SSM20]|uniref:hypothetical protein n=1 Tax=Pseudoalteromonas sp. SSM20 TaxID=3139394 RepID=UPI003BAC1884
MSYIINQNDSNESQHSEVCCAWLTLDEIVQKLKLPHPLIISLAKSQQLEGIHCPDTCEWFFHPQAALFFNQHKASRWIEPKQKETTTLVMEESKPNVEQKALGKDQTSKPDIVISSRENDSDKVLEFLNSSLKLNVAAVLPGMKGMSIRVGKKKKLIQIRENKHDQYFKLIEYSWDHTFSNKDIDLLISAHKRFLSRIKAKMPWKDLNYLLRGEYREINTFNELLDLAKQGSSKDKIRKIERMQKRYFEGSWGEKLLSNYCPQSFKQDFLDRSVASRQPSDRNEVIKIIKAAITKAKSMMNIKLDVQELVNKGERSRADKTDNQPPLLSTVSAFITESFKQHEYQLCLSMIIQLLASFRNNDAVDIEWSQVKFDDKCIELPNEKSKTSFKRHPVPKSLLDILRQEKESQSKRLNQTKGLNSDLRFIFESPKIKGQSVANFDNAFNRVKESLLKSNFSPEQLEDIKRFTRHTIRDLVEDLLMAVGASEAQKEKCIGRTPSDIGRAYANLSISALSKLKDKMVDKIESEEPKLKELFHRLIDGELN